MMTTTNWRVDMCKNVDTQIKHLVHNNMVQYSLPKGQLSVFKTLNQVGRTNCKPSPSDR